MITAAAQQGQGQTVVVAIRRGEREPVNAVHKPVREAIQPGAFGGVNQQAVVDVQRRDGNDDCRDAQPVDQKTVDQPKQQAHRNGDD